MGRGDEINTSASLNFKAMSKLIDITELRKHKNAFMDINGAAEALCVCNVTIRNYIRAGKLPAKEVCGKTYIAVKDVLKIFDKSGK